MITPGPNSPLNGRPALPLSIISIDPGARTAIVYAFAGTDRPYLPASGTYRRLETPRWPDDYNVRSAEVLMTSARKAETRAEADLRFMFNISDAIRSVVLPSANALGIPKRVLIENNADLPVAAGARRRQEGRKGTERSGSTLYRMGVVYALCAVGASSAWMSRPQIIPVSSTTWMRGGGGRIPKREDTLERMQLLLRSSWPRRADEDWSEDQLMALGMLNFYLHTGATYTGV